MCAATDPDTWRVCNVYNWEGSQPLISATGWDASGIISIAEYLIDRSCVPSMTVDQFAKLERLAVSETTSRGYRVNNEPLLAVVKASGYRETIGDQFMLSCTAMSERQSQSLAGSTWEAHK